MGSPKGATFDQHCRKCGKRSISELCYLCRKSVKIQVPCATPGCTSKRIVSYEYAKRNPEVKFCKSCATKAWVAGIQRAHEKRREMPLPSRLELNGCVLVRAAKGRCKGYIHCRNGAHANLYDVSRENDCCWRIAQLNWLGWRCAVKNPDIVPDWEERALMRQERPSNAGLLLDC